MKAASTLSKQLIFKYEHQAADFNIDELVQSAARVIAPLWPIQTFAARHPWMGLEEQTFEQTARRLKQQLHVDIYPKSSIFRSAKQRGEIDESILEKKLMEWLDSHQPGMPGETAEAFCKAALKLDDIPEQLLSSPNVKKLAKQAASRTIDDRETRFIKPLSVFAGQKTAHLLDHHVIKWCKLFLDESHSAWRLPHREKGFYSAWRQLVEHDPALPRAERQRLNGWPEEPRDALKRSLRALGISDGDVQAYFEAHLLSLPGWAGMMLWRSRQSRDEERLLLEYLAVRLSMEWMLIEPYLPLSEPKPGKEMQLAPLIAAWLHWGGITSDEWLELSAAEQKARLTLARRFDDITCRRLWLEAWEQTYAAEVRKLIAANKPAAAETSEPVLVQLAFCIDVRSEPFRRALEKSGPFETFGTAGFFNLAIETCELGSKHSHSSLPVILKPQHRVKETAEESSFQSYQEHQKAAVSLSSAFKMMKQNLLAGLLLPEVSGPWLSLQMAARSLIPRAAGQAFRKARKAWLKKPQAKLSLDRMETPDAGIPVGFTEEEKAAYARQALQMMGITDRFAPLVVICGHGSRSTNNPYASALDCGACGGASGAFNARVLAALCNLPSVRQRLRSDGIFIPDDTVFAAAEHITTLDELQWIYVPELPAKAQQAFDRINSALPDVSRTVGAERLGELPQLGYKNPRHEVERFAEDWSEVRPEWGLARNASFIIGSRRLTRGADLEGRAFLHSYDWRKDEDGSILSGIISGPGTVAQWINLQYYASTVAPHYYGSGNKATQTVTSGLGVMQGNASDLLAGLPWQSVMLSDQEIYHAPLRLLVVIEAPREHIERLLEQDHRFRRKMENGWIILASIDSHGNWENWTNTK
ncbi:Na-translocating system protein MpsB [Bacillus sonorensis]|uniref:Probable inorganic carbon transporter subunit DabA n=2 Tax=Bacillus sonorensis TaxID=119858 RepID=M5P8E9_9BACI|nr:MULTISPECIES: putative inorganic carbon transporter subunit DabA [Bacillus]TWK84317.1 hypothetical protein CHCC20335_4385 [Bacillus paralicheniformis]ASB89063.1 UPF0753 protein [Bacillus sonorensis]EME75713.1 hypothetical protein BSONL12_05343 [Bacillus sonorensis L12]MCZ0075152.1 Na-translocating system protein MpsB [Bacillus sonorensis]MCZ0093292.1 Na-translocating system protein MpsB [Bacillus sonorensis]